MRIGDQTGIEAVFWELFLKTVPSEKQVWRGTSSYVLVF